MVSARRLAPLLFAAAPLVIMAVPARAAEPLSLAWTAPAGCPSREDVLTEARRLLGGSIESDTAIAAHADIALAAPSDYRLRIAIDLGPGERAREVHAPTCAELGDAAALLLALAIDPAAVAGAPAGSSLHADTAAPPPPPAPAPLPVPSFDAHDSPGLPAGGPAAPGPIAAAPPLLARAISVPRFVPPVFSLSVSRRPPPPAAAPRVLAAHALVAAEGGTFRDPAPMVRAGVSLAPGPIRLEAALVLAWGGKVAAPSAPRKGGELWLGGGALSGCYEIQLDRVGPRPIAAACVGVEGGVLVASGYGVAEPGTGLSPWVAPIAGGLFRWAIARGVAARIDLLLAVPLVHPSFRIDGLGVVHEPGPVAVRAGAGVEIDLTSW